MNQEWAGLNKTLQAQLKKEATFSAGIDTLLHLRQELMETLFAMKRELRREDFDAMPFPKVNGYHNKTIAYSIWHVFRIEDIVTHSLIQREPEVFRAFRERIGAPIITTGNELAGRQIVEFSRALDLDALYAYAGAVRESTEALLRGLSYGELARNLRRRGSGAAEGIAGGKPRGKRLLAGGLLVREEPSGADTDALFRHWIMHVEASLRIRNGLRLK